MSSRARKITELARESTIGPDDLIIVEKVVGANTITSSISGNDMKRSVVSGPYENDTTAEAHGVVVGQLYYTNAGEVKVRLT